MGRIYFHHASDPPSWCSVNTSSEVGTDWAARGFRQNKSDKLIRSGTRAMQFVQKSRSYTQHLDLLMVSLSSCRGKLPSVIGSKVKTLARGSQLMQVPRVSLYASFCIVFFVRVQTTWTGARTAKHSGVSHATSMHHCR